VGGTTLAPDETLSALFHDKPIKRRLAAALLGYAKTRVRDRENLRFERTRIFGRARRVFLAMGAALTATGRIEKTEDVFFLTVDEVLGAAEGHAVTHDLAGLVALRKSERARDAALPDPPERILLRGAVGDRSARIRAGTTAAVSADIDAQKERRGTPCGSGRATGKVRVIRDPVADQLQPGEILVARHTDPGWIQHFVNAAAVVVERGSVLSHSAIVSRELGIPCVVALAGACAWLTDGEQVEVDGSTGTVRRIDA
jgi:pyruvate,water dikinase